MGFLKQFVIPGAIDWSQEKIMKKNKNRLQITERGERKQREIEREDTLFWGEKHLNDAARKI